MTAGFSSSSLSRAAGGTAGGGTAPPSLLGFSDILGSESACSPCPSGYYTSVLRKQQCDACSVGLFSEFKAATACLNCAPGKYGFALGLRWCANCPAGSFSSSQAATACEPCPSGFSAELIGSASCSSCHPGRTAVGVGHSSCENCTVGYFSSGHDTRWCSECELLAPRWYKAMECNYGRVLLRCLCHSLWLQQRGKHFERVCMCVCTKKDIIIKNGSVTPPLSLVMLYAVAIVPGAAVVGAGIGVDVEGLPIFINLSTSQPVDQ